MACIRALIQSSRSTAPFGKSKLLISCCFVCTCVQNLLNSDEEGGFNWDNLGFSLTPTDYMYTMKCGQDAAAFEPGRLVSFGSIGLNPAAGVLNYGQGIFEGMKAQRRPDGKIVLFRPDLNAKRMQLGADRMCMPAPSVEQFIQAAKETTLANNRWVPPFGKGSLYMRPMLLGSGAMLGVAPAPEYTYLIYSSPVGHYFKEGSAPMKLYVEEELHRAQQGGTGAIKSITNYGPVLRAIINAKREGFSDVLYLDSVHKRNIEEVSASNIFLVKVKIRPYSPHAQKGQLFKKTDPLNQEMTQVYLPTGRLRDRAFESLFPNRPAHLSAQEQSQLPGSKTQGDEFKRPHF